MTAVMMASPDAPPMQRTSRTPLLATWLFVIPVLTEGAAVDVVKLEVAGLALLAFTVIVVRQEVLPYRALERIFVVFAVLSLIVAAYVAFRPWPAFAGSPRTYDGHALLFVVTYTAVAVFAALFFEERLFERVIWRGSTLALWAGVLTCLFSRLTGYALLVNAAHGDVPDDRDAH